jgi:hypothetical protein
MNRVRPAAFALVVLALPALAAGCKTKVTQAQCEDLLDRYATLVVQTKMKDAPPEELKKEQLREREAARSDDDFKNCTAELSTEDYACAMKASTADALEKCLE